MVDKNMNSSEKSAYSDPAQEHSIVQGQLKISEKDQPDAAGKIPMANSYMRWTLDAAAEVLGTASLESILVRNNLRRLIENYPPAIPTLSSDLTLADHANVCTEIVQTLGYAGKPEALRIGRLGAKPALDNQGKFFNFAARKAAKLLTSSLQIKTVLDSMQKDVKSIYAGSGFSTNITVEDRGDKWAYIDGSCAFCAGKVSNDHICWIWNGTLEESLSWLTEKEFKVEQVECRAAGDSTCTWEIDKSV